MLSGIGPTDHLKDFNIPLIKDLPVGFNLQDHVGLSMGFATDKPIILDLANSLLENMTYELFQKGPLSSVGAEITAFLNSKFQTSMDSQPDLQITPTSAISRSDSGENRAENATSDEPNETMSLPIVNENTFSILLMLNRPESRGRVLLRSNNPFDKPVLRMNYFDKETDVERLADGGRIILELMETKAFKSINARYVNISVPLCPKVEILDEKYFECIMRLLKCQDQSTLEKP
ncbi:Glucose dehydrogenase [FAD, quinone] [Armadillidium vulgare]|nr:Glucose dehydrogenase [FAD, quinone] [Armadillidium vulgare]